MAGIKNDADCVVVNGRVWAGQGLPEAEAIAIRDGRIALVGSTAEVTEFGAGAEVIDAKGRRVIPGLIDSHIHMVRAGLTWNQNVDWSGVTSLSEGMTMLERQIESTPPGTWPSRPNSWCASTIPALTGT